ncbi:MAG: AmmeMemoRadiSam system protein B [Candidatus Aminicenantes bacterium]|nr:AmmeMemoRadiSam system protein B [Candidatus Aminicenantes bacterium]MDH5706842.1 AmmeMemoRadiSam system protein B [Candidatus Aminicenantes bacterium]
MRVPRLRKDIELIPASFEGKRGLLARDSLGLIPKPILLHGEVLEFMGLIDGQRDARDFQVELIRRKGGVFVSLEYVERLIEEMDSAHLLDSDRYRRERERIIDGYSRLEVRASSLAGHSYPLDPGELEKYLDAILSSETDSSLPIKGQKVRAVVAPHIDLKAGRRVYARTYRAIQDSAPKKVFLLGTGHRLHDYFVSLTEKDFETPLGMVNTDKDLVKKLREAGNKVVAPHDMAHRSEHSLELQLLFLQKLFGSSFSIIPVLFGSFHELLAKVTRPSEIPGMDGFLERLRLSLGENGTGALVVAGVDFSHVGPKFGHEQSARFMLKDVREHDQRLIDSLCRGDVDGFWAESRKVEDRYHVCGFSTMACLLEVLSPLRGFLIDYEIWQEAPTQSAVSFAGIAFN